MSYISVNIFTDKHSAKENADKHEALGHKVFIFKKVKGIIVNEHIKEFIPKYEKDGELYIVIAEN